MTENPDEDPAKPGGDETARDSLAGDLAKTLDPDVEVFDEDDNGTGHRTGD